MIIMANSALWQLICVQILFTQLMYFAVSDTDQDYKNVRTEHETIPKGTHKSYLNCADKNGTIWKRNGHIIEPKIVEKLQLYVFTLTCVRWNHEGTYTCHATKSGPPLGRIQVTVTRKGRIHTCGRPNRKPFSKIDSVVCGSIFVKDYPCCELIPLPAEEMKLDLQDSLSNSKTKCNDVYIKGRFKSPYSVTVGWRANSHGTKTWGWKIAVLGLNGEPNARRCGLVISKDKQLNRTIPNLKLNARYKITIQSLPESSDKPNAKFKYINTPHILEMCETSKGRECDWEFCFPVEDLKVTNYSTSPIVSWRSSPFYKSQHVFEVIYSDEKKLDSNKEITNGTFFNLTMLKHKYGRKYFLTVRPVFLHPSNNFKGKDSITVMFYTANPDLSVFALDLSPPSHNLKIIISVCVVTVCLFVVFLLMARRKFRSWTDKRENPDSPNKPNSDVLLVHDGHCESCNHATYLLANILCETGHITCFLDLCSTKEIAINGLQWYEDKLKTCGKIVVICTKESMNTYYNSHGQNNNFYQNSYRMVLKMILGEMANDGSNNTTQIFPVCFDYSSSDDIPSFLRDKRYFSLPLKIEDLLLSLSDLNARQIGVMAELGFKNSKLDKMINQWKDAIRIVEKKHCNNESGSLGLIEDTVSSCPF